MGSLKQDMVYVGRAWTIALNKISLPTCESNYSSHPWSFFQAHCLMLSKLAFLFLPTIEGKPRFYHIVAPPQLRLHP